MLSIDRILEISKKMGISIIDSKKGKHYILDDAGKEIEFNTNMLLKAESPIKFQEFELKTSNLYKLSDRCSYSYDIQPIDVDESSVIAT